MNAIEKLLVNNPLRTMQLRNLATHLLARTGTSLANMVVLEIGCGQGAGTGILLRECGAQRVIAFDFDKAQLTQARKRHTGNNRRAVLFQGDAARLPFAAGHFDAVVEFAILHHVPEWRLALREIARVLKPGGLFLYEEFLRGFTAHAVTRLFLDHPEDGMFTAEEFYIEMDAAGLRRNPGQLRQRQLRLAGTACRADHNNTN